MSRAIAKKYVLSVVVDSVDGTQVDAEAAFLELKQKLERLRSAGELSGAGFTVDAISVDSEAVEVSYQEQSMMLASLRIAQDKIEADGLDSVRQMSHFDDVEPLDSSQIDQLCERVNSSSLFVAS